MDLLKELSELELTQDVTELDLDGELPDIRGLETKYLYCNFNKALKLSQLPQTLELLSCNNNCRILCEEDAPVLHNVRGFIDANETVVDSWEHLFRTCPNIETLDLRRESIPGEVSLLKNLKMICIEGGKEDAHLNLDVPEGCSIVISGLGQRPKKYIYKNGVPILVESVRVSFDFALY